jgi:tetratricopeptide (TPR) repeat protein
VVIQWLALLVMAAGEEAPGKTQFEQARVHFDAGDFALALPLLEEAHRLSGRRPGVTRALAQCHRALGNRDEALRFFEEYLAASPPDAEAIAETIALIRKEAEAAVPLESPPPPPEPDNFTTRAPAPPPPPLTPPAPPAAEEEHLVESPLFWILTSVAVVAVGAGVAIGFAVGGREVEPSGGSLDRVLMQ